MAEPELPPRNPGEDMPLPAVIRRVARHLVPQKKRVLQAMALIVSWTGLALAGPYIIKVAIDDGIEVGDAQMLNVAIGAYVAVWILTAILVSLYEPSLTLAVNIAFTVFTTLLFVVVGVVGKLVSLGVWMGRGNSIGGIGLVLALIGFSMEVAQLLSM